MVAEFFVFSVGGHTTYFPSMLEGIFFFRFPQGLAGIFFAGAVGRWECFSFDRSCFHLKILPVRAICYPSPQCGPVLDLRMGILTFREKWERLLGAGAFSVGPVVIRAGVGGQPAAHAGAGGV